MNKIKNVINTLIKKFMTKEIILYLIFGVFTTFINIGAFYILTTHFSYTENSANVIAILLAVFFAYITNRKMVFNSTATSFIDVFSEICKFISSRAFTMAIEFLGFILLFDICHISKLISKFSITILVIILNFFLSKFFAFKNNEN